MRCRIDAAARSTYPLHRCRRGLNALLLPAVTSPHTWHPRCAYLRGGPAECPIVNNQVCGGNGVCGYDNTAQKARCFCYSDWIESDCQTPRSPFPSGAVAGAVIGGIILGAAGLLAFAWWQGRRAAATAGTSAALASGDGFYPSA